MFGDQKLMPTLIHYRTRCIGCNVCSEQDPIHWQISADDAKATLKGGITKGAVTICKISEIDKELSLHIAHNCPMRIIKVQD